MHGGKSLSGRENGNYKHGLYTKEAIAEQRRFRDLLAEAEATMREMV